MYRALPKSGGRRNRGIVAQTHRRRRVGDERTAAGRTRARRAIRCGAQYAAAGGRGDRQRRHAQAPCRPRHVRQRRSSRTRRHRATGHRRFSGRSYGGAADRRTAGGRHRRKEREFRRSSGDRGRASSGQRSARSTDEFEHWDTQFHQRLFAATRNELLASIHDILQVIRSRNAWIELKRKTFSENRRRDYCEQHGNVVAALEQRDADGAAQAMLRHIEAIEMALFGR